MKITLALSKAEITAVIMARSALKHLLDPRRPPVLTPDRRPALDLLIESAISGLALKMNAEVDKDEDGDLIYLRGDISSGNKMSALRRVMETAIADKVLAEAYKGVDSEFSEACSENCFISELGLRAVAAGDARILATYY